MTMAVLSVAESELYAMSALCQMALHHSFVLEEMGIMERPKPMVCQTDSAAAMGFASGSGKKTKIRHIDQRMEWVQELKDMDLFEWVHVRSAINKADIMTKVLEASKFYEAMDWILRGVVPPEHQKKQELRDIEETAPSRKHAKYSVLIKQSAALSQQGRQQLADLLAHQSQN
jgi:hypothetical protein